MGDSRHCAVPGCGGPARTRGWCQKHYYRWVHHGDTFGLGPIPNTGTFVAMPPEVRFWKRVDKSGPIPSHCSYLGNCWPFLGATLRGGYARFYDGEKGRKAHRWSYQHHYGPIPDGMLVCHRCDNPPCVRPDHLFLGTNGDNMADKKAKGRNCYGDANGSRKFLDRRPRGESSPVARLSDAQAIEIFRTYHAGGVTQRALAEAYNISPQTVSLVATAQLRYRWLAQFMQ